MNITKRPIDVYVGRRISERRFALRLTADAVAERAGITVDHLMRLEMGMARANGHLIFLFSDVLQVKPSWFFQ